MMMGDNLLAVKACLLLLVLAFLLSPCLFTWLTPAAAGGSFPLPSVLLPPTLLLPPRHDAARQRSKEHRQTLALLEQKNGDNR